MNWLQVLTCAKLSKFNEGEGDEFEAEMIFFFFSDGVRAVTV
jgi:hypothetical protein